MATLFELAVPTKVSEQPELVMSEERTMGRNDDGEKTGRTGKRLTGLMLAMCAATGLFGVATAGSGCMSAHEMKEDSSAQSEQAVAAEQTASSQSGDRQAANPTPRPSPQPTREAPTEVQTAEGQTAEQEAPAEEANAAEAKVAELDDSSGAAGNTGSEKAQKPRQPRRPAAKKEKRAPMDALMAKRGGSARSRGLARADMARRHPQPEPKPQPPTKRPQRPESNTENYKDHGVNPMTRTSEDAKSTFAIDVDTGSYTIARRKLNSGRIPPASSVRVEEFVNYFGYDYPNPDRGAFGVNMEAARSPFSADKNRYLMRVGVQGKRITRAERKPVHLTFLVDVSGSMRSRDKLGMAKRSLQVLVNNLREGDTVALATYAGRTARILDPTGIENRGKILGALNNLRAGGSTAMNSGLEIAYKLALTNYKRDHVNRVIVLSDGDANVGPSSHRQIQKRIKHFVDEGVTLSTIGLGMGNYNDTMMEQLANTGNGNYYYIDTMDEARKVFGEQVDGTLQVIAKDVKIQVEFEDSVKKYRLIGYENRDVADKDFRNDKVDAGEIGAGHNVTALYELEVDPSAVGESDKLATVRIRHKEPQGSKASEQAFAFRGAELIRDIANTSDDFQFAAAVTGFAEKLRKSPYAGDLSWTLIEEIAASSTSGRADREEFVQLVKKARKLQ